MSQTLDRGIFQAVREKPVTIARVAASASSPTVIAAPGAGKRIRVVEVYQCLDASAAAVPANTSFYDSIVGGSSTFWQLAAQASSVNQVSLSFPEPVSLSENAALESTLSGAGTTFYVSVAYYIADV